MVSEKVVFGGGCFWCVEAIFKRLKGVESTVAGYSAEAEVIQIKFDPKVITYETLLKILFKFHDPTTLNRQGADVGSEYRSVIFYHSEQQKEVAERIIKNIQDDYENKIVTEVVPFTDFKTAEDYHQDFYAKNPAAPYCQIIIEPKVLKLLDEYKKYLK